MRSPAAARLRACSLGGVLTKYLGWEWIFWVNVPVGAVCLLLTPRFVNESRVESAKRRYDVAGATTITSGLILLVLAVSKAPEVGWTSARTIGLLVASAVLMLASVLIESRTEQPLLPFSIFRVRAVAGANVVGFLLGGAIFGSFFLLTQYMQIVLRYSALEAGVAFLAIAGTSVLAAGAAQALVTRVGVKPILAIGMALLAFGQFWYTLVAVHSTYVVRPAPGFRRDRNRDRVRVRARLDCGARGRRARRRRSRLRSDQYDAADRRCARHRDRLERGGVAHGDASRGRVVGALGADRRVRVGLLGRLLLRRRGSRGRTDDDPPRRRPSHRAAPRAHRSGVNPERFAAALPELFDDFPRSEHPRGLRFDDIAASVPNLATENTLAVVALAASLLDPGERYVEAGSYLGASLIAAARGNPAAELVAIDYFRFGPMTVAGRELPAADRAVLEANLERLGVDRVTILEGETLAVLRSEALAGDPIGVFFYDAGHGYEEQLEALRLIEPRLADPALVIVDDSDWDEVRRAVTDYVAAEPRARLLVDIPGEDFGYPQWWSGMAILAWSRTA